MARWATTITENGRRSQCPTDEDSLPPVGGRDREGGRLFEALVPVPPPLLPCFHVV